MLGSSSQDEALTAAGAIGNVAAFPPCHAALAAAGAVAALVPLLKSRCQQLQAAALSTLRLLCQSSPERCAAAVTAGAIPALNGVLAGPSCPAVRQAASSLIAPLLLHSTSLPAAEEPVGRGAAADRQAGPAAAAPAAPAEQSTAPSQPTPATRVCAAPGCGATRGLRRCGGCNAVRYCSEACSRTHWREHRAECRRMQAEKAAAEAATATRREQQA